MRYRVLLETDEDGMIVAEVHGAAWAVSLKESDAGRSCCSERQAKRSPATCESLNKHGATCAAGDLRGGSGGLHSSKLPVVSGKDVKLKLGYSATYRPDAALQVVAMTFGLPAIPMRRSTSTFCCQASIERMCGADSWTLVRECYHGVGRKTAFGADFAMLKTALPSIRSIPSDWLRDCNSFLLSAVCHLVALVLLALLDDAEQQGLVATSQLFAQMSDGVDAPLGGGDSLDDSLGSFKVEPEEAASRPDRSRSSTRRARWRRAPPPSSRRSTRLPPAGSKASRSATAAGRRSRAAAAMAAAAPSSSASAARAASFVYVVDVSGSMNEEGK